MVSQHGKDDIPVFADMADSMPDFKWLMDTSERSELDGLCCQFPFFYQYAQALESIAARLQDGSFR
jgi:hypothetical protein